MEDFKSFRIILDYADESGKRMFKEQTIKVNTPKLRNKGAGVGWRPDPMIYLLSFTIQIPEVIHSFIIGKSVPVRRSTDTKDYKQDFPKSINAESIEVLTKRWSELIDDYVWLRQIESTEMKKVIFYEFNNKSEDFRSYWNGTPFGEKANLGFKYAIGYVSLLNDKEVRYNQTKISISSSNDREFYALKYVDWTEEREKFFVGIHKSFEAIIEKIHVFEESITEDSLNSLISNSNLNFLKG